MTRSSTLALALFLGLTSAAMAQTSTDTGSRRLRRLPSRRSPPRARQLSLETKSDPMAKTEEAKPAKPVEGQIVLQDQNSILASTLIGSTVYTPADETVGDINDVIVGLDGKIQGEIGVGGFLGLGEKDVAVQMDKLTVQPQDASKTNVRLILNSTKADLEAAPEFKSVAAQTRETESGSTGSTTMPALPSAGLRLDQPVALGAAQNGPTWAVLCIFDSHDRIEAQRGASGDDQPDGALCADRPAARADRDVHRLVLHRLRNWRSSTNIWHAMEPTEATDVGGGRCEDRFWRRVACGREKPSWGQVDTRQQGNLDG